MAEFVKLNCQIQARVQLILSEAELRALDALAGYGTEQFLEWFYKNLGRHYLEPHEARLYSLFETVRGCASLAKDAEECREFLQLQAEDRAKKLREMKRA